MSYEYDDTPSYGELGGYANLRRYEMQQEVEEHRNRPKPDYDPDVYDPWTTRGTPAPRYQVDAEEVAHWMELVGSRREMMREWMHLTIIVEDSWPLPDIPIYELPHEPVEVLNYKKEVIGRVKWYTPEQPFVSKPLDIALDFAESRQVRRQRQRLAMKGREL